VRTGGIGDQRIADRVVGAGLHDEDVSILIGTVDYMTKGMRLAANLAWRTNQLPRLVYLKPSYRRFRYTRHTSPEFDRRSYTLKTCQ